MKEEYKQEIDRLEKQGDIETLGILKEDAEVNKIEGIPELAQQAIDNLNRAEEELKAFPSPAEKEIANLDGDTSEIQAEVNAKSSEGEAVVQNAESQIGELSTETEGESAPEKLETQSESKQSEVFKKNIGSMVSQLFEGISDEELLEVTGQQGHLAETSAIAIKNQLLKDPSSLGWEAVARRAQQLGQNEKFDAYETQQKQYNESVQQERFMDGVNEVTKSISENPNFMTDFIYNDTDMWSVVNKMKLLAGAREKGMISQEEITNIIKAKAQKEAIRRNQDLSGAFTKNYNLEYDNVEKSLMQALG